VKAAVYVDGFNLYYRALKPWDCRWLDLQRFICASLPDCEVTAIKYFTARVGALPDPGAQQRQMVYLAALAKACPLVEIIEGHYSVRPSVSALLSPVGSLAQKHVARSKRPILPLNHQIHEHPDFPEIPEDPGPKAHVLKIEEKGSDVNLAVHLVHDAHLGRADTYAVVSQDSDLAEAIRIAAQECNADVGLLTPQGAKPSHRLISVARWHRTMRKSDASSAKLPLKLAGTAIEKPEKW
jgi:hypothetical protein